ncbi:hypothetical protein [Actinomadura sp. NEAU-AAG7]|uniref:hypothetical protein n=1 Tax=Actinomadura sp. NEAU-AAG7 TaxID=2839640 RepID=UPI001BE460E2|nr:hypothetical protein [Actinomadura sp. NEAU-AAG7]MBT2210794.1 hypothetical protein [Actinomadura sp. NEAU-AAG7]
MINANGIELMAGSLDPAGVQAESARLRTTATGIRETGENVVDAWTHGLNPHVYSAPEGDRLRLATRPVQTETAQFAWQLWQVAGALADYATEIAAIKARLLTILGEARSFLAQADPMGAEWLKDDDMVERNNGLEARARAQAEALAAAEERCANRIYAAYGGHAPGPVCTAAPPSPPPWGTSEKGDDPWYEDAWHGMTRFGHGMWDVTWGAFSTLAFVQGKDKALDAWKGMGRWALASAVVGIPGAQGALMIPSVRNIVWRAHKEQVKGLTAWDEWRRDPARAGGQVFGNLLLLATLKKTGPRATTVLGRGAQQALRGARYLDPMTAVPAAAMKSLGLARQVGDLIKTRLHTDIPEIASPPPATSRPGLPEFRDPNGGFEPVNPGHPKEPSLTGAPHSRGPQEINGSHIPPSNDPPTPGEKPPAGGGRENGSGAEAQPTDPTNAGKEPTGPSQGEPPTRDPVENGGQPGDKGGGESHQTRPANPPDPETTSALRRTGLSEEEALRLLGPDDRRGLRRHLLNLIDKAGRQNQPTLAEVGGALRDLDWTMHSGKLHTDSYAQLLANLGGAADGTQFRQAWAEIGAARDVIEHEPLAPGTQVLTHAKAGHPQDLGDGTRVDISPIGQADLLYRTHDGVLHADEVKHSFNALRQKIQGSRQHNNLLDWRGMDPGERNVGYRVMGQDRWMRIFGKEPDPFFQLWRDDVPLTVGGRKYTPAELLRIRDGIESRMRRWVAENPGHRPSEFFDLPELRTVESAIKYVFE